jgi:hypothetical protein
MASGDFSSFNSPNSYEHYPSLFSAHRDQHRLPNPYLEAETDSLVPPHSSQSSGVRPLPKGAMDTTRTPSPAHHLVSFILATH